MNNSLRVLFLASIVNAGFLATAWAGENENFYYPTGPNQNLNGSNGYDYIGFSSSWATHFKYSDLQQLETDFTLSGTWAGGVGNDLYYIEENTFIPKMFNDEDGNPVWYEGPQTHVDFDLSRIVINETGNDPLDSLFIQSVNGKDMNGSEFTIPSGIEMLWFFGLSNVVIRGSDLRDDIVYAPWNVFKAAAAQGVTIYGNGGDDIIAVAGDGNSVYGGNGNDSFATRSACDLTGIVPGYDCYITQGSTYYGGSGDDFFEVIRTVDRFVELPGEGFDTISIRINNFVLDASKFPNIEQVFLWSGDGVNPAVTNLVGSAQADTIIGNEANNNIAGVGGADKLAGGDGNDSIAPGGGNDTVDGGTGADSASFSGSRKEYTVKYNKKTKVYTVRDKKKNRDGIDTLKNVETLSFKDSQVGTASSVKDGSFKQALAERRQKASSSATPLEPTILTEMVRGSASRNWIYGGEGSERLAGTAGADLFYGDFGTDIINMGDDKSTDVAVYFSIQDSTVGTTRDQIERFDIGNDRIDLSRIDADRSKDGRQTFTFSDTHAHKNSVWYQRSGNNLIIKGDVNGNTLPDFEILLKDVDVLSSANLIL